MDQDAELAKFKWLLIAAIGFLVSGYLSLQELRYVIWSHTVEAQVTRAYETTQSARRGRKDPVLAVEYAFKDKDGTQRNERDFVSIDWPVPQETVAVQYLSGIADSSRLVGHSSSFAIWVFLGFVTFLGASLYFIAREADAPTQRKRKRR